MGSDVTPHGLRFQFTDRIRPLGRLQLDALAAGNDPKDIDLSTTARGNNGQKPGFLFSLR
jgi:hypothetical protein